MSRGTFSSRSPSGESQSRGRQESFRAASSSFPTRLPSPLIHADFFLPFNTHPDFHLSFLFHNPNSYNSSSSSTPSSSLLHFHPFLLPLLSPLVPSPPSPHHVFPYFETHLLSPFRLGRERHQLCSPRRPHWSHLPSCCCHSLHSLDLPFAHVDSFLLPASFPHVQSRRSPPNQRSLRSRSSLLPRRYNPQRSSQETSTRVLRWKLEFASFSTRIKRQPA